MAQPATAEYATPPPAHLPLRPKPKPSSSPSDAASRVFAVPELAENIFQNLSFRDLFVIERVSQTFRNTIASSIKLQRAMFLQPTSAGKLGNPGQVDITCNPLLLLDLLDPDYEPAIFVMKGSRKRYGKLLEAFSRCETKNLRSPDLRFDPLAEEHLRHNFDIRLPKRQKKKNAKKESWRRVLVTSSPVRVLSAGLRANKICKNGRHRENKVKYWHGFERVTMGMMYDFLEEEYKELSKRTCCPLTCRKM